MAIVKDRVKPENTSMEEPSPSSPTTTKRGPGRTRKTVSAEQRLEVFGQLVHDLGQHLSLSLHERAGAVVVVVRGVRLCPTCERLALTGGECVYCPTGKVVGTTGKAVEGVPT